ncbi:MAG: ABC transporter ATP-binding protein [Phycisphaerales bacterium]
MTNPTDQQAPNQPDIYLQNVSVTYQSRTTSPRRALIDFSLSATKQTIALLGPNGSGKSTLLNIIAQTIKPDQGQLIAPTSRADLSIVFQTPALDELLTIRENLLVAGALYDIAKDEIIARANILAADLGIADRLNDQIRHLSGGLARRADLARALIPNPKVLLLDEPTTGLDIDARHIFWDTLARCKARNPMTTLIATHITDEATHADRVVMIRDGQIIQDDTPTNLTHSLGDKIIRIPNLTDDQSNTVSRWLNEHAIEHIITDHHIIGKDATNDLATSCPIAEASITIAPPTLDDVYSYYAHAIAPAQEHAS